MDIQNTTDIKELKAFAYDVMRERERLALMVERVERRIIELEQQERLPAKQESVKAK